MIENKMRYEPEGTVRSKLAPAILHESETPVPLSKSPLSASSSLLLVDRSLNRHPDLQFKVNISQISSKDSLLESFQLFKELLDVKSQLPQPHKATGNDVLFEMGVENISSSSSDEGTLLVHSHFQRPPGLNFKLAEDSPGLRSF